MKAFLVRLKEPSSWAAIAGALGVFGINVAPEVLKEIVQAGTGLSALAALLLPEKGPQ